MLVILKLLKLSQNLSSGNFNIKMLKRFPGGQEFESGLKGSLKDFQVAKISKNQELCKETKTETLIPKLF